MKHDRSTWWNIEHHQSPYEAPEPIEVEKYGFFEEFIQKQARSIRTTSSFTPDLHPNVLDSSNPFEWIFCTVGIQFTGYNINPAKNKDFKIFLLGNPVIWIVGTLSLIIFPVLYLYYRVKQDLFRNEKEWNHFCWVGRMIVLGWILHYVPYLIMQRVKYLHHYFPALYFSLFMQVFLFDTLMHHVSSHVSRICFMIYGCIVITIFLFFAPLSYGFYGDTSNLANRQWISTWLIDNNVYS